MKLVYALNLNILSWREPSLMETNRLAELVHETT